MNILESLEIRASKSGKTVVLPETQDPRIIKAAFEIQKQESGKIILIGKRDDFAQNGTDFNDFNIKIRSWDTERQRDRFLDYLVEKLKKKNLTKKDADHMLSDSLVYAGTLVALDEADAAIAGSVATTGDVIRAGLNTIGVHPKSELVSSTFLMSLTDDRTITYSDCGVVPYPDSGQLASIGIDAGHTHQKLTGETPAIAFLSFSTKGSASHERVDLVRNAVEIARSKKTGWNIDGELQFDAAWLPEVAERKAPDSSLKGDANVFIFPNLDAGNIAYKITERLAGARATGPILQGLTKPYLDLSRGCSVDDIISAVHVASVLAY